MTASTAGGAFLPKTKGIIAATIKNKAVPANSLKESACLMSRPVEAGNRWPASSSRVSSGPAQVGDAGQEGPRCSLLIHVYRSYLSQSLGRSSLQGRRSGKIMIAETKVSVPVVSILSVS